MPPSLRPSLLKPLSRFPVYDYSGIITWLVPGRARSTSFSIEWPFLLTGNPSPMVTQATSQRSCNSANIETTQRERRKRKGQNCNSTKITLKGKVLCFVLFFPSGLSHTTSQYTCLWENTNTCVHANTSRHAFSTFTDQYPILPDTQLLPETP